MLVRVFNTTEPGMDAREMTINAAGRCADCGVLRVDGADGLCPHCRLRRMWRGALREIDERYVATWVALSALVAVMLFVVLLGGGVPQHGLLALAGG